MQQHSLSAAVLDGVTPQLLSRQAALRAELQASAQEALAEQDEGVSDTKDRAEERMEHTLQDQASTRAARELAEVNAALDRLAQGRYGICLRCGLPIPEQRLLAMPSAAFCAGCQSLHELAAAASPAHAPGAGR